MSRFFIARPIFAWAISIFIMLVGAISIAALPVSQYPDVAPVTIQVTATYPGAPPSGSTTASPASSRRSSTASRG